jgi:hypothetical protein
MTGSEAANARVVAVEMGARRATYTRVAGPRRNVFTSQEAAADRKVVTLRPFLRGEAISGSRAESETSVAWSRGLSAFTRRPGGGLSGAGMPPPPGANAP